MPIYLIWVDLKGQGHRSMLINADQQICSMLIDWTKIQFSENIMDRVKELQIEVFLYMPILDMGRPKRSGSWVKSDQ